MHLDSRHLRPVNGYILLFDLGRRELRRGRCDDGGTDNAWLGERIAGTDDRGLEEGTDVGDGRKHFALFQEFDL